jgi:hypothetical protein
MSDRIDAYLDDALSPAERAAFEQEASSNPALRDELALQRRIDGRLRGMFVPPDAPQIPGEVSPAIAGRLRLPVWLRVAAILAIAAVGAWLAVSRPWQGPRKPALSAHSADEAMKFLVSDEQFKPVWVCGDDKQFAEFTRDKLKVPFLVRPEAGVQIVGWTYEPGLFARKGQVLLARADGKQVIVAMAPEAEDRTMHTDPGSPLHITRNLYKGVVMYEISPLDHPVIVNAITQP